MTDIRQWLEERGLGDHATLLVENEVDLEVLPELSEEDLEKIGLALGPRKKLLKAIREPDRPQRAESSTSTSTVSAPSPSGEAERRQLTVMFADLVGSTELSQELDLEDLREVNRAYQDAATAAIEKYGGYVARYMGDGVLAYFGYPQAHEDDPERALRAGLEVIGSVSQLDMGVDLAVRVGVATGPVVVGDIIGQGAAQESAVVGETPNLAARLQGIAEPGSVVLSAETQNLVAGRFDLEALGPQRLKGIAKPVEAFRALAVRKVGRFDAALERRLTPLVGRDEELGILQRRWGLAVEGEGQAVLLSGEAGVGKSRIVRGLQDSLGETMMFRVLYHCSPYHQSSAFHPVIEHLERSTRIDSGQAPREKLNALEKLLAELGLDVEEVAPILAELLSIPYDDIYPALNLTTEQLRLRTLEILAQALVLMTATRPVLYVVEDVHWIDPSTQDFLTCLLERIRDSRMLVVVTHRPEYQPPWTDYSHVTALALNNLGRRDSAAMVAEVTGGRRLPKSLIEEIVHCTDGVPLFIEEISAALDEIGIDSDDDAAGTQTIGSIPTTLQDLLMERLDRLGSAKAVAQQAAVIGRSFTFGQLSAACSQDKPTLERELVHLTQSGLIYGRKGSSARYDFKHALVRDAAYQSLLKSDRRNCHGRIATALVAAEEDPPPLELIAHHFEEGGHRDKAARYWHQAGKRALGRFAHAEAISDFRRALGAIESSPADTEQSQFELETHTLLGPSLMYVLGQGAPEVERTYSRALELGEQLDDSRASFTSAWGLWRLQFARSDLRASRDYALKCQEAAARSPDPVANLGTAFALGATSLFSGDCSEAVPHFEESIKLYRDIEDKGVLAVFGQDPGLSSLAYLAWARWSVGYPDQAVPPCEEAVKLARDIGKPVLIAIATGFAGMTYSLRRDVPKLMEYAEECLSICEQHQFRQHAAMSNVMLGCAYSQLGEHARAIALAEDGVNEKIALGSYVAIPWFCYMAAETNLAAGQRDKALEMARMGIEYSAKGGERFFEPENHRIQALILAQESGASSNEIKSHLDKALTLAKSQGAKSLELRSAVSCARIAGGQGDRAQAREQLASIYDSFAEGFDTPDLEDAKALLDALA